MIPTPYQSAVHGSNRSALSSNNAKKYCWRRAVVSIVGFSVEAANPQYQCATLRDDHLNQVSTIRSMAGAIILMPAGSIVLGTHIARSMPDKNRVSPISPLDAVTEALDLYKNVIDLIGDLFHGLENLDVTPELKKIGDHEP